MNLIDWLTSPFKSKPEPEPKPHIETDTKCDLCEYKEECESLLEITTIADERQHFIRAFIGECKKEGDPI